MAAGPVGRESLVGFPGRNRGLCQERRIGLLKIDNVFVRIGAHLLALKLARKHYRASGKGVSPFCFRSASFDRKVRGEFVVIVETDCARSEANRCAIKLLPGIVTLPSLVLWNGVAAERCPIRRVAA